MQNQLLTLTVLLTLFSTVRGQSHSNRVSTREEIGTFRRTECATCASRLQRPHVRYGHFPVKVPRTVL